MEIQGLRPGMRVIVAMSGGVDSSVCAYLAKQAGCEVVGITFRFMEDNTPSVDAERVAKHLGIEWYQADYREQFQRGVIDYFMQTYREGRTPNPCAYCNRTAKVKYLFDMMQKYNAEAIITGHYARTVEHDGKTYILASENTKKDQSYYLSLVEPFHLALLRFPLGEMDKEQTREIARGAGIPVAEKKDSQDICFLAGGDYRDYLREKMPDMGKEGFMTVGHKKLKKHEGIANYTIGQRQGLGVSWSEPLYVRTIDAETGEVKLATRDRMLFKGVKLTGCVWVDPKPRIDKVRAKLRYRMNAEPCTMEMHPDGVCYLLFDEPQFAPAPGQVAAVYEEGRVLGGGYIEDVF